MNLVLRVTIATVILGIIVSSTVALAGQKVYLGTKSPQKLVSIGKIDHGGWNLLLQKYVDKDGLVDYRSWKASPADMRALDSYLGVLSTADAGKPANQTAKLAFWINAYNAVTVKGMLREYPTTSIRNHTAKLYGYNIWKDLLLYVGGTPVSLDQMEHSLLRKMGEPRIHCAVVCASKGCPRLLNEAYVADRVAEQLDTNSRDFFAREQNFRHDTGSRRIYLSSILKWYGEDFGANQTEQLRTLSKWLPTAAARQAAKGGSVRVSYLGYDWTINEQPAIQR